MTALELDTREFGSDGFDGREHDPELTAEVEDRVLPFVQNRANVRVLSFGEGFTQR